MAICSTNGDVIIYEPSTVSFHCDYENPASTTMYEWYLGTTALPQFDNQQDATISIPSGSHVVRCEARIVETPECTCMNSTTLDVVVVGT